MQLDPSMIPLMNQYLNMIGPMTEEQVFMLAMMVGKKE